MNIFLQHSSVSLQSSINDGADFKAVADAMKVIGFTGDEIQTVYKILASILHLVISDNTACVCVRVCVSLYMSSVYTGSVIKIT